ncbi:hypothetical protein CEXT_473241 [Caerostris extrusa]|uniref:Uncharacterized protein n=1 Tax=Caerostris extrusa TaxID=172846 RepID=A0AAV4S518_CAEEX|nr:hypothetical protein CEXT_473241 [Caerostris extrusa]
MQKGASVLPATWIFYFDSWPSQIYIAFQFHQFSREGGLSCLFYFLPSIEELSRRGGSARKNRLLLPKSVFERSEMAMRIDFVSRFITQEIEGKEVLK